ncbi:MAG: carotenoid oxygenase family protein [Pseudonocardiaceae bacterium]
MTELSAPAAARAYLPGFTSLDAEIDVDDLPVHGTIPDWLRGTLTRNGPAHFEAGSTSFRHWFDGQAMLHRFTVADGRVSYRNRFLRTESSRMAREDGRIGFREFATDPCRSTFARFFTLFQQHLTPNASVNVVPMNGGYVALTEMPLAVQFDPDTLETLGVTGYHDQLDGQLTTAHPHQQPGTNNLINYVLKFGPRSEYRIYRQRPGSMTRELVAAVPAKRPGYLHSFAVTEDYAVLAVFPLVVNPLSLLLSGKPFIENYRWRPELGTRFIVVDLHDGTVRRAATGEAVFAFHHINAYQDGGQIVLDLCAYPDASIIEAFYLERLRNPGAYPELPLARPTRYRVDPTAGTVSGHRLSDEGMELPQINYRAHNGHAYRYAYAVGRRRADDFFNQLVTLDVHTGQTRTWHQPGTYPGEPVFVPAPEPGSEDHGVILSVVLDSTTHRSFLLVLDAATCTELARAEVPHTIPFGFHGHFA